MEVFTGLLSGGRGDHVDSVDSAFEVEVSF